jgi:hypothetical protein
VNDALLQTSSCLEHGAARVPAADDAFLCARACAGADCEQFVQVRFLTPYDMSELGQCEGEGCVFLFFCA